MKFLSFQVGSSHAIIDMEFEYNELQSRLPNMKDAQNIQNLLTFITTTNTGNYSSSQIQEQNP